MKIVTEYNEKELTKEQIEALAAVFYSQMVEYYKNNNADDDPDDHKAA